MPFTYNTTTNAITMACGDTGGFSVSMTGALFSIGDILLFAIFDKNINEDLLCKAFEIVDGSASIRLCNHDTRDIEPGTYNWNLRVVTSPVMDENGNVVVDECSDDVITIFDKPPKIKLMMGGARV